MKNYSSSIDRENLRRIKEGTTPEQRMNWLEDAIALMKEAKKHRRRKRA